MHRVVVTGVGAVSALGQDWAETERNLRSLKNRVQCMPEWQKYRGLNTNLASPIDHFELPPHFTRKRIRSMGRVAQLATVASERALQNAGLLDEPELQSGRVGVSFGSSTGSTKAISDFGNMLINDTLEGITATTYIRMMGHTAAVNIGVFFGLQGRIIPTSTACTSGSMGIGYAFEVIRHGLQDVMLAGGAEELCPTEAAVFDTLFATSTLNNSPQSSPRPFERDRDGLVIGEGACTLILENREHALARGAPVLAEIVGFATNSDGCHVTQPSASTMQRVMEMALESASLDAADIGYISAHGTATDRGDVAESSATRELFADRAPISAMKSYIGHTLGACGALESWFAIEMMKAGWFAPTINLDTIDPACEGLDHIRGQGRDLQVDYVMNNNFAFGGINTSLIFRRAD